MYERNYDGKLGIRTAGIREWKGLAPHYSRYEATPYEGLDKLFEIYKIEDTDRVVDYGCGRGRVAFYIHNRFKIPVTGIELHEVTYDEAITNKMRYEKKIGETDIPIRFEFGYAQDYEIDPKDNIFYFFNPFAVHIFEEVVENILRSVKEHKRTVDIILFYPLPKYTRFLRRKTDFKLIEKIKVPKAEDRGDKFFIYRLSKGD